MGAFEAETSKETNTLNGSNEQIIKRQKQKIAELERQLFSTKNP
jgi:hypothetical protein